MNCGFTVENVFIGFGSNQGNSEEICLRAIECLGRHSLIHDLRVSSFYRTEPVGMVEQGWFINGVVECRTSLEPEELLDVVQAIEKDFGRTRGTLWGPRTLDLDILVYGERQIALPNLTIPHPRLHERRFVLVPLDEISPDWVHPTLNRRASELLERLETEDGQTVQRL